MLAMWSQIITYARFIERISLKVPGGLTISTPMVIMAFLNSMFTSLSVASIVTIPSNGYSRYARDWEGFRC